MQVAVQHLRHTMLKENTDGSDIASFRYLVLSPDCETELFIKQNTLLFVEEGHLVFKYGDTVYKAFGKELVFIKKNILLQYKCDANTACFAFNLQNELVIEFATLAELKLGDYQGNSEMLCVYRSVEALQTYVNSLRPYILGDYKIPGNLARLKLLELLFCLSENHDPLLSQILDVREQFHPDVTQVVEENIMNALSLNQLARQAGRSVSSFRRDFLSIYNMPPSRWIRRRKLEKAQELLVNTTMTVTSICYTMGFQSIAHFSRIFKANFGYSPTSARFHSIDAQTRTMRLPSKTA